MKKQENHKGLHQMQRWILFMLIPDLIQRWLVVLQEITQIIMQIFHHLC